MCIDITLTRDFSLPGLDKIFSTESYHLTPEFRSQLEAIKSSYENKMRDALLEANVDLFYASLTQYHQLYDMFSDLKAGKITQEETLKVIENVVNQDLERITINNIQNIRLILYYAAVMAQPVILIALLPFIVSVTTPVGPLMVLVALISITASVAVSGIVNICWNFKSTTPVYEEKELYKKTMSFFKPEPNLIADTPQPEHDPDMLFCGS